MGTVSARIRHRVLRNLTVVGIQFSDIAFEYRCEPDISCGVRDQAVGTRIRRLQRKFSEASGSRVEAAELVSHLSGVPERAIGCNGRIMWAGMWRGHIPFPDRDLWARSNQ